ncbi:citrate lyase acyl carrier protein [bacterium]|nr:citrate lyase acyl carrier protein [bacterium]
MKEIQIGSVESNDLLLSAKLTKGTVTINNMTPEILDGLLKKTIGKHLTECKINKIRLIIHYNGANEWVIRSRCKSLAKLIEGEQ